ncbi:hypothetical protein PROFUN_12261 [Planoprotostelium fungivorum]|uniref:Uncharacterized protein n=1 Tax=Planoprotostelium fungivorum TaxID=1890364 RepID=A0A2P6N826_9EUKA|nr:hypothetical protein PROFUN_12261 [Planoprotostelium fungivorum]
MISKSSFVNSLPIAPPQVGFQSKTWICAHDVITSGVSTRNFKELFFLTGEKERKRLERVLGSYSSPTVVSTTRPCEAWDSRCQAGGVQY